MNVYPSEIFTQPRRMTIHTNASSDFQVFGTVDIQPVHRHFLHYGPHQNYIPHHVISEKSKPDLYKLDNASSLLRSNNRQYFDYTSHKNNHFRFSSAYTKSDKVEDESDGNKGIELQHVIDHLKFMMKQRRKPLKIDHNASKLLGLPSYCAYISQQSDDVDGKPKERRNAILLENTKSKPTEHSRRGSSVKNI